MNYEKTYKTDEFLQWLREELMKTEDEKRIAFLAEAIRHYRERQPK